MLSLNKIFAVIDPNTDDQIALKRAIRMAAIVEVAKEINAQVVVIGLSTRSALMNRLTGYMADKLLQNIDRDIMVVVPDGN